MAFTRAAPGQGRRSGWRERGRERKRGIGMERESGKENKEERERGERGKWKEVESENEG